MVQATWDPGATSPVPRRPQLPFVFVFAGGHVCTILATVPDSPGATPMPVVYAAASARCSRPDVGAIAASLLGYMVIAAAAYMTRPGRQNVSS